MSPRSRSSVLGRLLAVLFVTAGCNAAPQFRQTPTDSARFPRDCTDLQNSANNGSGVYNIFLDDSDLPSVEVYCELVTSPSRVNPGGWTMIQKRPFKFGQRENFNRSFADYKEGFGNPGSDLGFWLGLENIWRLTAAPARSTLRIGVGYLSGYNPFTTYGVFSEFKGFKISSEEHGYMMDIDVEHLKDRVKQGNREPTHLDNFAKYQKGQKFATYDKDTPTKCAKRTGGGWWWYPGTVKVEDGEDAECPTHSFLNGPFPYKLTHLHRPIVWRNLIGVDDLSWRETEMMIRRL